ncbi:bifunctional protein GlmU-like [Macrobrachium rosenbergii]|uniref:bifunctional protein GlmU-like n=1 Tax=Macrobrachium rosenbergii TaxID=79674 RepID=UPI0034D4D82E
MSSKVHILRLKPGQEVKQCLEDFVTKSAPNGVAIMTCCGSVTSATLRFAADSNGVTDKIQHYNQHFEVLAMSGTVSKDGPHLHICLGDNNGATIGGHVMGDLKVFTTMELALCEPAEVVLKREQDPETGYDELTVTKGSDGVSSSKSN